MAKLYAVGIKCPCCNKEMYLDDVAYTFDGNQNEYYICENCDYSAFVRVRHGKVISKEYRNEDGNIIKE